MLQHDYSLTRPEGIQSTWNLDRETKDHVFFLVGGKIIYTWGFFILCFYVIHICVKVAGRESERGQNVNASVFLFTVQPVCFSFL